MLRLHSLHSVIKFRSALNLNPFPCQPPGVLLSFPIFRSFPSSQRIDAMSGRTVADVLMGAARAASEKKGRPPLKHTAKEKEAAKKAVVAEEASQGAVASPSVDDKIAELSKKASEFEPKAAAFWKDGEHVPFLFLARALDLISNESGRIAITEILCNVFRTVVATTPGDLLPVVYLSANKVAPAHEGVELGIGDAAIIKVLAEAFGRKEDQVKSQMKVFL